MRELTGIVACVFDMDGLLLDSERLSMAAMHRAGAEAGLPLPEAFCRGMIGSPADRCAASLRERFGSSLAAEALLARHAILLDAMVAAGELKLKRGVPALLDALDARGIRRAVATSSERKRALRHLAEAGILHRFAAVVTRDDVERGKPHPEPFLLAAARLGVAPADCLALEDSHAGVRSAHAAGMRVVMVPDLLEPTEEIRGLAHGIAADLHAVAALLDAA